MSFVTQVISSLKNRYPLSLDLYKVTARVPNLQTGTESVTKTKISIRKAIVLPPQLAIQISNAVPSIGEGMKFGGTIQSDSTTILIDGKDVPTSFVINVEDCYAVIKGSRYEIVKCQEYLLREAFILTVKGIQGTPSEQILDRNWNDDLSFSDQVGVS